MNFKTIAKTLSITLIAKSIKYKASGPLKIFSLGDGKHRGVDIWFFG
jgi:hypothetical protein